MHNFDLIWAACPMRVLAISLIAAVVLSGCSMFDRTPPEERIAKQLIFTIADGSSRPSPFGDGARDTDTRESLIRKILNLHGLKKIAEWPIRALGLSAIVAEVRDRNAMPDVIESLENDSRVQSVSRVRTYEALGYNDTYYNLQNRALVGDLENVHGYATGRDVTVAIVDTGVDRSHPDLVRSVDFAHNYVAHDTGRFDGDEHGTAVAGVIASSANNEIGIVGIAPQARLRVYKACAEAANGRATCDSISLIRALVEVVEHRPNVLNLSLAGPDDPLIGQLLRLASEQGVVLVAAVDPRTEALSFPASMAEVISVGTPGIAGNHDNPNWTIAVPGSEVLTTTPGATYGFRAGSSMAAAYISAVSALILERSPGLTASEVRNQLRLSAERQVGTVPLIDLCSAVTGEGSDQLCSGYASQIMPEARSDIVLQ